jgi:hypothetical protein
LKRRVKGFLWNHVELAKSKKHAVVLGYLIMRKKWFFEYIFKNEDLSPKADQLPFWNRMFSAIEEFKQS